ncbi:hypothetical protein BO78DRAFT_11508 [Aspergillus sclerotiicarbonarius CBS 121057]|uniref:Uncharacterized protein n=1 Tax=Aspergillus sclerotiicarbonarius (strain CBS 121057 / IBT 28362) TaxID=1448318 RepID=A0A319EI34_ASPSB|nr:hypothetical protein BO78DRAFT_11508 [Aspergillus sclerotiicarbonarius CBS 121057]
MAKILADSTRVVTFPHKKGFSSHYHDCLKWAAGFHSLSSAPSVLSESPPGPQPPPTPAEPGLSTASAMSPSTLPQLDPGRLIQPTVEPIEDSIPLNTRQRR